MYELAAMTNKEKVDVIPRRRKMTTWIVFLIPITFFVFPQDNTIFSPMFFFFSSTSIINSLF